MNRLFAASAVTVSAIGLATAAGAQSAGAAAGLDLYNTPADASAGITEVIVTATRRSESLQDVPMSVDVATGEQLQRLNILDAKDVQQLSPGLELTNTSGRNNTATLRGITFDPDQGTPPAVDLYFNEIPIDAQTAFTAIYDVEQIEVLRGPQGALRGRTAPAGAITMRTRRANLASVEGYTQGTLSDEHAYNFQGAVSVPLITDKLALRVSGLMDGNRGNQVYNINRDQHSKGRTESARVSLAWSPIEDLDVNLMYHYLKADNRQNQQVFGEGNGAQNPPIDADDYRAVHEGVNQFENSGHLITLSAAWDLGPVILDLVAGRQDSELTQPVDLDSGNAVPGYIQFNQTIAPYDVDTIELRVSSNNDGFWNWTAGAFYSHHTGDTLYTSNLDTIVGGSLPLVPGVNLFPLDGDIFIPLDTTTKSVSASSRFEVTDQLTLEFAGRYAIYKNQRVSLLTIPDFGTIDLIPPGYEEGEEKYTTGGATLTYEFNSDLTAYLAFGHSFRAGSVGVGAPQNLTSDLLVTNPEKTNSFELGLKTTFMDDRLSLNAGVFYQKFDGYLARFQGISYDIGTNIDIDGDGVPDGVYVGNPDGSLDGSFDFNYNGDATVRGIEATLAGRPSENWDFSLGASFAKARYDNAQVPCNVVDPVTGVPLPPPSGGTDRVNYCETDGRLSETPDFNLTANTEVRFPIGSLQPFVRGLLVHRPSVSGERTAYRYNSRQLLNLFVGIRDEDARWELSVFAKNVLDQQRITNISSGIAQVSTLTTPFVSWYRTINTTSPRELGVSASYRF